MRLAALALVVLAAAAAAAAAAADSQQQQQQQQQQQAERRCRRPASAAEAAAGLARRRQSNSSSDPCAAHGDCFACNAEPACGWCPALCGGELGCHTATAHVPGDGSSVCGHDEDGWVDVYGQCPDACGTLEYCEDCLGFVVDSTTCGWCGDGSGCQRGTAAGVDTGVHRQCNSWRFRDPNLPPPNAQETEGLCTAQYEPVCADVVGCGQCVASFMNATASCHYCHPAADGSGAELEGACVDDGVACPPGMTVDLRRDDRNDCPFPTNAATHSSSALAAAATAGVAAAAAVGPW